MIFLCSCINSNSIFVFWEANKFLHLRSQFALVAELVDALDSKSSFLGSVGSIPTQGTNNACTNKSITIQENVENISYSQFYLFYGTISNDVYKINVLQHCLKRHTVALIFIVRFWNYNKRSYLIPPLKLRAQYARLGGRCASLIKLKWIEINSHQA